MSQLISNHQPFSSELDKRKLFSFDVELLDRPASPVTWQICRFCFCDFGRGTVRIQGNEYRLVPGALFVLQPWEVFEVTDIVQPVRLNTVNFHFDPVNDAIRSFYNTSNNRLDITHIMERHPIIYCDKASKGRVFQIFQDIRREVGAEFNAQFAESDDFSDICTVNKIVELIVLFCRGSKSDQSPDLPSFSDDKTQIFRYIYTHLNENLTLKKLSRIFYLSESTISAYIRENMGFSFHDLVDEMRVGRACNYLLYTDLTLVEMADVLGYVDSSHMAKLFYARVNMKINEYRRAYQRVGDICRIKESRKYYEIVAYIYRHYQEDIRIQDTLNEFKISSLELNRILLHHVEMNWGDFVNYLRINRACRLLLETDRPIVEIAVEVGYNTTKTFHRNFYRLKAMTPGAYRASVRLKAAGPGEANGPGRTPEPTSRED